MKYLKLYEEMELANQMSQLDIEDILLEVKDIGYDVVVEENFKHTIYDRNDGLYYIKIYKNAEIPVNFDEIKDCVLRLKDYLGDRYIRCHTYSTNAMLDLVSRSNWQTIELNEDTTIDYEFRFIKILYKM